MAKYELKTKVTDQSVLEYIQQLEPERRKEDALMLLDLMHQITGEEAKMWGPSIIGFGSYHYQYESGHEGDMMLTGFSPRKGKHSIYILNGFSYSDSILERLGKHKIGKSCLYVNKLADIDLEVLKELVEESVDYIKNKKWP